MLSSDPQANPEFEIPGVAATPRNDGSIMAAYGLYTHIASNKSRSMLLLAGLFLLIYVLVFAGALVAEVFSHGDRSVDFYLRRAVARPDRRRFPLPRSPPRCGS